jgi:hypothetical protein
MHANFVSAYNPHAKVHDVGSILLQPKPELAKKELTLGSTTVIFDVTPFEGLDADVLYHT